MFLEEGIFGTSRRIIDKRGRVFLPKFTGAEENDQLVICLESPEYLTLYNVKTLIKRVNNLRQGILTCKNQGKINMLEIELERIFNSCITKSIVDSQRRVLIPADLVIKMDFSDEVGLVGTNDSLRVFKPNNVLNEIGSFTKKM